MTHWMATSQNTRRSWPWWRLHSWCESPPSCKNGITPISTNWIVNKKQILCIQGRWFYRILVVLCVLLAKHPSVTSKFGELSTNTALPGIETWHSIYRKKILVWMQLLSKSESLPQAKGWFEAFRILILGSNFSKNTLNRFRKSRWLLDSPGARRASLFLSASASFWRVVCISVGKFFNSLCVRV